MKEQKSKIFVFHFLTPGGSKMKKAPLLGIMALFLVGILAAAAFAMPFDNRKGEFAGNEALRTAFESGDYEAYLAEFEESDQEACCLFRASRASR